MKIYEKLSRQILRSSHDKHLVVTLPIPQMNLEKYEHPWTHHGAIDKRTCGPMFGTSGGTTHTGSQRLNHLELDDRWSVC